MTTGIDWSPVEFLPDGRVHFTEQVMNLTTGRPDIRQVVQHANSHLVTYQPGWSAGTITGGVQYVPARFDVWVLSEDEHRAKRLIGFSARWAHRSDP